MKVIKRQNEAPLFDQLFDGFFRDEPLHWMNRNMVNHRKESVNILENESKFQIELLAPGYRKEDLHIEVDGDLLTLKAERKENKEEKESNYLRREFRIHNFERQFRLPEDRVNADAITARFEDGILHLIVPKKEENKKASRLIEIN